MVSPLSGWALGAAAKKDVFEAPIRQTVVFANLAGLAVIALSILLAASVARRITVPIKALETGARALRHHQPVSFAPTDVPEVDHALQAFEAASKELRESEAQRVKSETTLFHASRLSEIGQMAAALAHELNQPLTAVTSYIGGCRRLLRADLTDPEQQAEAARGDGSGQRPGPARRRDHPPAARIRRHRADGAKARKRRQRDARSIDAGDCGRETQRRVDPIRYRQAGPGSRSTRFRSSRSSSIWSATPSKPWTTTPRKELGIALTVNGDRIEFSVSDTGTGLAPEMTDRLFKPFSSTKSQGMGIGLSVCREIVEAHDGKIWAEPNPGGGMRVPLHPAARARRDDRVRPRLCRSEVERTGFLSRSTG